jgi:hypothetical protein
MLISKFKSVLHPKNNHHNNNTLIQTNKLTKYLKIILKLYQILENNLEIFLDHNILISNLLHSNIFNITLYIFLQFHLKSNLSIHFFYSKIFQNLKVSSPAPVTIFPPLCYPAKYKTRQL